MNKIKSKKSTKKTSKKSTKKTSKKSTKKTTSTSETVELAAIVKALKMVHVPGTLIPARDKIGVSIKKLSARICSTVDKQNMLAVREAAKAVRDKAKAERAAIKNKKHHARIDRLKKQLKEMEAELAGQYSQLDAKKTRS